jgi:hypothetical protein
LSGLSPYLLPLAKASFASGYQAVLVSASLFAAISALLSWLLIRAADTAPLPRRAEAWTDHLPVE